MIINKKDKIHIVGIGGIGMSGIAEIMFDMGYQVQGSDVNANSNTERLVKKNIKVFVGHKKSNIKNVSTVFYSTAIKNNNIEIVAAQKNKIPTLPRSKILSHLMRLKKGIAISGSHGKTTTTTTKHTAISPPHTTTGTNPGGLGMSWVSDRVPLAGWRGRPRHPRHPRHPQANPIKFQRRPCRVIPCSPCTPCSPCRPGASISPFVSAAAAADLIFDPSAPHPCRRLPHASPSLPPLLPPDPPSLDQSPHPPSQRRVCPHDCSSAH